MHDIVLFIKWLMWYTCNKIRVLEISKIIH